MRRFQGTGWLLTGIVLGVAVPAAGLHTRLLDALGGVAPWPWGRILLGLLLFWSAAALYFRSHWLATARELRSAGQLRQDAARRLAAIVGDGERWAFVLRDNLIEIGNSALPDRTRELYREGAVSHADKIVALVQRCRVVMEDLDPPPEEALTEFERDPG